MDRKTNTKDSVLIIAAEASSIAYAARLIQYWKRQGCDLDLFGIGSQEMETLGFRRLGRAEDMAVVGFSEILEHYSEIKRVFYAIIEEAKKCRPKIVILMDYPGFNLKLARVMSELGIPVVYYIAPQIWAWKQNRVHVIKKYCTKTFLIFPFEVPFYEKHGVSIEFVGNPLLEDLNPSLKEKAYQDLQRQKYGIQNSDLVLGIMPGSRKIEIKNHLKTQLETAQRLQKSIKNLKVVILVAPTVKKEQIQEVLDSVHLSTLIVQDKPFEMIALTDFVLVASGTATLMV
ncbi:MAG TPA: lipid-A-disaccharide synthase, partial [Pseudobdellovibrionaceae bacterium]|nr:lipid-A-disaccharide synthase [Pseudobdellovibrionaceae bacterium]